MMQEVAALQGILAENVRKSNRATGVKCVSLVFFAFMYETPGAVYRYPVSYVNKIACDEKEGIDNGKSENQDQA